MIRQLVPSEFCLKCRSCCRFKEAESVWSVALLKEEVKQLVAPDKIPPVLIKLDRSIRLFFSPAEDSFVCPLLDAQNNHCKIYAERPFECQLYPFLFNRKGNKVFLAVHLSCPFVQENMHTASLKEYCKYLAGILKEEPYSSFLSNNARIIRSYNEVLDLEEL